MGLFGFFTGGHRSLKHKRKRAPSHDTRQSRRIRETTAALSTPKSPTLDSTRDKSRRKDIVTASDHRSKQSCGESCGSTNHSHVTVDGIGTSPGRSINLLQNNHSEPRSQRAKREPLSSPLERPMTSQCSVSIAHEYAKTAKPTRASSAGSGKHEGTVTKALKTNDAKQVNLRDHFPSPTEDPCNKHPAIRRVSPAPAASSARPALPPRPSAQPQSRREEDAQTEIVDDHSTDSSSPTSARSSPCASAITEATTVVPEEIIPRSPQQEYLRQLSKVGFAIERRVCYPMFGTTGKRQVSFEVSKHRCGHISHRVDSSTRKGRSIVFPRNTTGTCDSSQARSGN